MPEALAARFGANLHYARLAGHGRDMDTGGEAMAEPEVADWIGDVRRAAAIGGLIGERTVILSTSTGGALVALAAAEGLLPEDAALAFLAPNFRISSPLAMLLHWPAAEWWLPPLAGRTRSFEPANEAHAEWWTTRYPAVAAFLVAAAARAARRANYAQVRAPAFVAFDPLDRVVDHTATRAVMDRWPGPVELHVLDLAETDDPSRHVVAGEVLSPATSPEVEALLAAWIEGLGAVPVAQAAD